MKVDVMPRPGYPQGLCDILFDVKVVASNPDGKVTIYFQNGEKITLEAKDYNIRVF